MIKKLALAAGLWAAGTLLVLATPAQATLIGQTVTASFDALSSWSLNRTSATVSATAREFVFTNAPARRIIVDVQDGAIDFQYNNISNIFFFPGDLSITIGGLTWAPNPRAIIGVNVTEFNEPNSIGGFGANIASFTDSSVTLALNGVWDGQDRVRIDLITGLAQLPEPASLALFGLGLLGLGVAVRRRRDTHRLSPSGLTRESIHQLARDGERRARLCSRPTPRSVVRTRPIDGSSAHARG